MTRPFVRLIVLVAALFATAAAGSVLVAYQEGPGEQVTVFGLPPPPPLGAPAPEAPPVSARALAQAKQLMAPPPPRAACITPEQRNAALAGTGCSCTCGEYARKPVSDKCDIACMGHYSCWGPIPSEAEVGASYAQATAGIPPGFSTPFASLPADERETLRGAMRMTRALEWDQARLCGAR
ncbi:hypothetical protein [Sphingomonas sp.]|uniref:hypothetical protein n=1 Tax=Sphingomonas sp. TaxID=28214 RepID=UPI002DD64C39|nr:hypothetical protein [Sphingomonas sp.]